jgi:hypothetical protein
MPADIIEFYRSAAADGEGRRLDEILAWDYIRLELIHDFIQWLFPLPEPSQFNDDAPVLTSKQIQLFHADASLRENLLRSTEKLLGFYGFELVNEPRLEIKESDLFALREPVLYGGFNHNHLRVTRILRSLTILGLPEIAKLFLLRLNASDHHGTLPQESLGYWSAAVAAN